MITLALDTATPTPSLAVARDAVVVAARQVEAASAGRRVAEEIHGLLESAELRVRDVDRIVVGVGPGGFTGLRIGMATALALGQALAVDVVGVSSLETLALGMLDTAADARPVMPVIDARRREVFTAVYAPTADGGLRELVAPSAAGVDDVDALLDRLDVVPLVAGDGVERIAEVIGDRAEVMPAGPAHAIDVRHAIGWSTAGGARPVTPMYLRLPDAEVNRRRRDGDIP